MKELYIYHLCIRLYCANGANGARIGSRGVDPINAGGRRCVVVTLSRKTTLLVFPPQVGRRPRSNAHNMTDSM